MEYPELIAFFAAHKVAEIESVPEYQACCAKNVETRGFRVARDRTEMAKKEIESKLDAQPGNADQVRQSLRLLASQRGLDLDLYNDLISSGYKPKWSPAQQVYFEHATRIIRSGNYFFLSFTNRGPAGLSDLAVNRRYRYFIRSMMTQATRSDWKDRNLLADAIDTMLRDVSPDGFYYRRHEKDQYLVKRRLQEACESCLVFVQLVDNAMFDPPRDPNYCEFEYRQALGFIRQAGELDESRVLFVVTEEKPERLQDPDRVFKPYQDWVKHIRTKSAVYLSPVPNYDRQSVERIRSSLDAVARAVKAAKDNMFDRVPV